MDDLKHQVEEIGRRMDEGFAQLRGELRDHRRDMDARFDRIDERFDRIDQRFDRIDQRFDRIDQRFEKVDERFERVDERFEKVDAKFETIHDQIVRTQEMVIGLHATLTRFSLGLLGAVIVAVVAALVAS
jgi:predicted nuclease with TOPRIM domain